MPLYDVHCANCGLQEAWAPMSTSDTAPCPVCGRERPKAITLPNFTEDRLRFWKGPLGNGYSTALGAPMPGSRAERDRMARAKGVEFVSVAEHLAENRDAAEAVAYAEHVKTGGERFLDKPPAETAAFIPKPAWAKDLGL